MKITKISIATVAILVCATSVWAQGRKPISPSEMSKYVVSAKAGVVNVVEGEASVRRSKPFAIPEMLISGDELLAGDTVKTGARGRAEVLLNPGCYLRLGEESEFVFQFDSFTTSNKIQLLRGSVVIEVSAIEDPILVEASKAKFEIARDGLYRFNIGADARAEVAVRKGQVLAGNSTIKGGKRAIVDGGTTAIAKLNKQDVDELDDWSKGRAKALIAANSRLSYRGMRRSLGMSLVSNAWIYDPFCRCYTFLPSTGGFSSPYGWNYSVCNPYWYYYSGPRYHNGDSYGGGSGNGRGQPSSGGGSGGGSGSGGGGSSAGGGHHHQPPPPMPTNPDRGSGGNARGADRERPAPIQRRP